MSEETQNPHYALGEEDVRNRRDIQRLQNEVYLPIKRRDFSNFIWHGDPRGKLNKGGYNGNTDQIMAYVFGLVRTICG